MVLDLEAGRLQLVIAEGVVDNAHQAADAIARRYDYRVVYAGIVHQYPFGIVVNLVTAQAPDENLLRLGEVTRPEFSVRVGLHQHAEFAES